MRGRCGPGFAHQRDDAGAEHRYRKAAQRMRLKRGREFAPKQKCHGMPESTAGAPLQPDPPEDAQVQQSFLRGIGAGQRNQPGCPHCGFEEGARGRGLTEAVDDVARTKHGDSLRTRAGQRYSLRREGGRGRRKGRQPRNRRFCRQKVQLVLKIRMVKVPVFAHLAHRNI